MKKNILLIISFVLMMNVYGQDSCFTSMPFCSGISYVDTMNVGIAAPVGPDYNCLSSQAGPYWISIYVTTPGSLDIQGAGVDLSDNPLDIDYIYWGPFSGPSGVCYAQLDAAHVLGCDYSTNNQLDFSILGATVGSYYIAMVSNYSGQPAIISYSQTSGTGSASCILPCSINTFTATPSACDSSDNTYSLSGMINFSNPPTIGTLTVFGSCGGSQTFTPPFVSPLSYLFPGLPSDSSSCFVTAIFSDSSSCSIIQSYQAPALCNPFLSVKEIGEQVEVTVFPNPTTGNFDVKINSAIKNKTITISDVLGKQIYSSVITSNENTSHIDLSSFQKGIYFIKVSNGNSSTVKKIILN